MSEQYSHTQREIDNKVKNLIKGRMEDVSKIKSVMCANLKEINKDNNDYPIIYNNKSSTYKNIMNGECSNFFKS